MVKFAKYVCFAALMVATAAAMISSAQATGALAVGIVNNDRSQLGLVYGYAYNYPAEGEAKYQALLNCLTTEGNPPAEVSAACRLFAVFNNQCVSMAGDPEGGQTGWGWAVKGDKSGAEKAAMDKCRATAGAARAGSCVALFTVCDEVGATVAAAPSSPQVGMFTKAPAQGSGGGGTQPGKKH